MDKLPLRNPFRSNMKLTEVIKALREMYDILYQAFKAIIEPSSTVTSVTGTAPISSSGGTTPAISISAATTGAAGSMSAADKSKLDGIAAGAQVNTITSVNGYTGAVITPTENRILDPDMILTGVAYWHNIQPLQATLTKSTTQKRCGLQSLRVVHGELSDVVYPTDSAHNPYFMYCVEDEVVYASAWVYPHAVGSLELHVYFYQADGTAISSVTIADNSGSAAWEVLAGSATAPALCSMAGFAVQVASSDPEAYSYLDHTYFRLVM